MNLAKEIFKDINSAFDKFYYYVLKVQLKDFFLLLIFSGLLSGIITGYFEYFERSYLYGNALKGFNKVTAFIVFPINSALIGLLTALMIFIIIYFLFKIFFIAIKFTKINNEIYPHKIIPIYSLILSVISLFLLVKYIFNNPSGSIVKEIEYYLPGIDFIKDLVLLKSFEIIAVIFSILLLMVLIYIIQVVTNKKTYISYKSLVNLVLSLAGFWLFTTALSFLPPLNHIFFISIWRTIIKFNEDFPLLFLFALFIFLLLFFLIINYSLVFILEKLSKIKNINYIFSGLFLILYIYSYFLSQNLFTSRMFLEYNMTIIILLLEILTLVLLITSLILLFKDLIVSKFMFLFNKKNILIFTTIYIILWISGFLTYNSFYSLKAFMFRYCIYQKTLLYLVESNIFPKKELYFNSEISLNKPVNKPIKLESKPDIILITLDSLRNDYAQKLLSINDGGFLNFSKNSYNFTNAYSHSSYTVSSISSLFTGKYLTSRFDTKDKSLVKILDNNSYVTYSLNVNSAPLLFEEFIINDKKYKSIFSEGFDVLDRTKSEKYNHSEFRSLFSSFINKRDKTKPFFAWVHFSNLHMIHPFVFFENFFSGDNFKKKYKSLLIESDENLEMFINIIKQNNLYDNSIIILTSDHGEGMKDHGSLFHVFGLYEEYVRVPLFIKFPKQKTFKIIEDKVSLIDVFPTILEYTDSENQYTDYDGLSLINLIENTKLKKKYTFLSFCLFKPIKRFENFSLYGSGYNNKKIIIETAIIDNTNSYKLIKNHIFGYEELYNLNDDPREQNNLIDDESKIAKYLRKELFKKISRAMVD